MPSCRVYSNCFLVTRRTTLPPDKQSRRAAQTVTKCTPDQNSERTSTLMPASPYCQVHRHTTTTCPSPPATKQLLTVRYALALFLSQIRPARSPMLPARRESAALSCSRNLYPLTFFPLLHNYYLVSLLHHPGSAGVSQIFRSEKSARRTHTHTRTDSHIETDTHMRMHMQLSQHHTPSHSRIFPLL